MDSTPDIARLPGEGSPFWIQSPLDIRQQFKLLCKRGERIRLWYGPGESIVSLVLDITQSGEMVLDVGPDARSNQRLLTAHAVVMHGNVDGVDLKCTLGPMRETVHDGLAAFTCALPKRLHRLQRREYHRVSIPVGLAVKCEIPQSIKPADTLHAPLRQGFFAACQIKQTVFQGGAANIANENLHALLLFCHRFAREYILF